MGLDRSSRSVSVSIAVALALGFAVLAFILGMTARTVVAPAAHEATIHPTGLIEPARYETLNTISPYAQRLLKQATATPVNLSADDPPIGNQEQVGSCVEWSSDYYLRYWHERHDLGITISDSFAPMYAYEQLTGGTNPADGTSFEGNFGIEQTQGIPPADRDSYGVQGAYYGYDDVPTTADRAAAAGYTIPGYHTLFIGDSVPDKLAVIMAALDSGQPVVVGIHVYDNFMFWDGAGAIGGTNTGTYWGDHAIMVDTVNADSDLSGPNSWGTGWGDGGRFELGSDFVASDVFAAYTQDSLSPQPTPKPLPQPTSIPTVPPPSPTFVPPIHYPPRSQDGWRCTWYKRSLGHCYEWTALAVRHHYYYCRRWGTNRGRPVCLSLVRYATPQGKPVHTVTIKGKRGTWYLYNCYRKRHGNFWCSMSVRHGKQP